MFASGQARSHLNENSSKTGALIAIEAMEKGIGSLGTLVGKVLPATGMINQPGGAVNATETTPINERKNGQTDQKEEVDA